MLVSPRTGHIYPQEIPGTQFRQRLSRPQVYSTAWRIALKKNYSDIIGNRTRDIPAYSAVLNQLRVRKYVLYFIYVCHVFSVALYQ